MYLSNAPGVWIPLSDEELERAGQLRDEIAELAQTEPESERHEDRLTQLSLLIGTAAVGAAVAETEGEEAEKKWRAKHSTEDQGPGDLLVRFFRDAWRQWRQRRAAQELPANVVALRTRERRRSGT